MNPILLRRRLAGLFLAAVLAAGATAGPLPAIVEYAASNPDGRAAYSFNVADYRGDLSSLPIGVFDSGIGGLTVLEAIYQLDAFHNDTHAPGSDGRPDFSDERFIYFGDQANMPYGNYPKAGRTDYFAELVMKDALFLLGRRVWTAKDGTPTFTKPPVKAIVIACNTATAYGLADLRAALSHWGIPVFVVGVVEAGARGIAPVDADRPSSAIAVFATVGTCASEAYPKAIAAHLNETKQAARAVIQQGSPTLAGAIEGDPASFVPGQDAAKSVMTIVRNEIASLVEVHRIAGGSVPIGSVVLGCTHYPLVQDEINRAFAGLRASDSRNQALIAEHLEFVNPAELTAKELYQRLIETGRFQRPGAPAALAHDTFYVSVANRASLAVRLDATGGLEQDYKYSRRPGRFAVEDTIAVPMRLAELPLASANLIREKLPAVAARLQDSPDVQP